MSLGRAKGLKQRQPTIGLGPMTAEIGLECARVVVAPGVTHLKYRVGK
jgi:hypothetical protein